VLRIEQAVAEVESPVRDPDQEKEPNVAGKKRPKPAKTQNAKPKRPKKTSRGK
jgi:hypothetical protein